ncbi:hypothetical protein DKM44_07975 [Deinococcus irradiatisoli]|uniref:PAS domain-containing protein n=1 Tax=Deinococcus irradiatisoli TaxID=2202254 RepID=A0A2Z3JIG4_9DEIO|nr:PAS domain S-box protein [Deinococcus irradiatisoli]AWN23170.1 hypothetical protein DKM44_07975 [Deinococcus irradiatisoli]
MSKTQGSMPPAHGFAVRPIPDSGLELLKKIAEYATEPALLQDGCCVVYVNPALTQMLGYAPDALLGSPVGDLLHPQDASRLSEVLAPPRPGEAAQLPPFHLRHADGSWVQFGGQVTALPTAAGGGLRLAQLRPVQRQRDTHREALREITRTLAGISDVPGSVEAVLNTGLQVMHADAGSLYLLSPDGEGLEMIGQAGYKVQAVDGWQRLALTLVTPISQAARQRGAVFLSDAEFQQAYPAIHAAHSSSFSSAAVLPLLIGERLLGTLSLSFNHDRLFTEAEQEFLQIVADLCASALDRALLYQEKLRQQSWDRLVNQHSSDIVTIIDDQGVIHYESGSVQSILGYAPSDLIGQSVCDLIHPDEPRPAARPSRSWRPPA